MLRMITALPAAAFIAAAGFFRGLRKDERGLSGVVVAILLILIAVLAVVLIWGFMSGWLEELWNSITDSADRIH